MDKKSLKFIKVINVTKESICDAMVVGSEVKIYKRNVRWKIMM